MTNPYPRRYICDNCGYNQVFSKKAHKRLRGMFCLNVELRVEKKGLPLFLSVTCAMTAL